MKFIIENNPFDNPKEVLGDIELIPANEFEEWCMQKPKKCLEKITTTKAIYEYIDGKGWKVIGGVGLNDKNLTKIPIKFYEVFGVFTISDNPNLKSLKNSPIRVFNGFFAINTGLTSLEWAPRHVDGSFIVEKCDIQDLGNTLKYVGGNFWITHQKTKRWSEREIRKKIKVKGKVVT